MAWETPKIDWGKFDNWARNGDADLLRVIHNCTFLEGMFNGYAYPVVLESVVTSGYQTMGYLPLINTMVSNVKKLKEAFYTKEKTPTLPDAYESLSKVDYSLPNALEHNLLDMKDLLDNMIEGFDYSGLLTAGGEIAL